MRRFLRHAAGLRANPSRVLLSVALSAVGVLALSPAQAQAVPEPIVIVVPYAANGPTDRTLRAMLPQLSRALDGATINVKNMPSAGGVEGLAEVAKAAPNGRTLLFTNTNVALLPALGEKLPFNPLTDFSYLGLVLESPMVVLGRSTLSANTPQELAKWLSETNASQIRLADAGAGSASYLCGLFLQSLTGKTFSRTEFPGSAPAMKAIKEGQVDLLCDQTPTVKGPLAAGEVRGYAVTTSTPLARAPFERLTTLRRMFSRDLELTIWHGFYAPKGLAQGLQTKLNAAIVQAVSDPAFVAAQEAQGVVMVRGRRTTPEGHRSYVEETIPLWHLIASISRSRHK